MTQKYSYRFSAVAGFLLVLAFLLSRAPVVYATSGACSYHGGVDCSAGPASDGNAICNDDSESSVPYDDMEECQDSSQARCPLPIVYGCTTQSEYTEMQSECTSAMSQEQALCNQEYQAEGDGLMGYTGQCSEPTPATCTQAALCQAQINEYQSEVQQTNQCIAAWMQTQQQEEQLQDQEQTQQFQEQQQTDEQQEQAGYQEVLQAAQAACEAVVGPNGTASIENNKCINSCNSGYQADADGFCEPIPLAPISSITTTVSTNAKVSPIPANGTPLNQAQIKQARAQLGLPPLGTGSQSPAFTQGWAAYDKDMATNTLATTSVVATSSSRKTGWLWSLITHLIPPSWW
jgi:hypothetical protein